MNETDQSPKLTSAQVVLHATATNDQQQEAVKEFAHAGFTTGKLFANSFAITAPVELFEKYFQIKLESTPEGGTQVSAKGQPASFNLPVNVLPANITNQVKAILFTKPPDFGPGGGF